VSEVLLLRADARRIPLRDGSMDMVCTSPPYWSLRDYGVAPSLWGGDPRCVHAWYANAAAEGYSSKARWQHSENVESGPVSREARPEAWTRVVAGSTCSICGGWLGALGLEPTIAMYLEHVLLVFSEVWRVLRPSGTLWLNMGDSYNSAAGPRRPSQTGKHGYWANPRIDKRVNARELKPKDLVGMPWRVAFALQDSGWWLRSAIVWAKRNPMPESVTDRPTRSYENVFLLSRSRRYYYCADAIREPHVWPGQNRYADPSTHRYHEHGMGPRLPKHTGLHKVTRGFDTRRETPGQRERRSKEHDWRPRDPHEQWRRHKTAGEETPRHRKPPEPDQPSAFHPLGRNARDVWRFSTQPYRGAHFAVFPEELARRCVLAGCPPAGVVLDPFAGAGTVGKVALELGRSAVLCDLGYHDLARRRVAEVQRRLPGAEATA